MITPSLVIFFVAFAIIILVVIRFWLNQLEQKSKISDELMAWLKSSTSQIDSRLNENMKMFNSRLDNAARVIAQVQKNIGEFSEIGRSMQELQELLQSPKLRGNIGEQVLKQLLGQHFPKDSYTLQYGFKNGDRVDAVIKTTHGIIPIDSKFPIDNFRRMIKATTPEDRERSRKDFGRDVKKHIEDISKKYILADEGTVDYAIMYVSSEAIYYEILSNETLFDYAGKMRVLPVSPMSFYAYIKAILMSFEGARIQSQAKEILSILQAIKKDYEKTDEALSVLTRHITNAYNQISQVTKSFLSLGQKLTSTRLLSSDEERKKLIE